MNRGVCLPENVKASMWRVRGEDKKGENGSLLQKSGIFFKFLVTGVVEPTKKGEKQNEGILKDAELSGGKWGDRGWKRRGGT